MVVVIPYGKNRPSIHRQYTNRYLKEYCGPLATSSVLNLGAYQGDSDKEGSTYEAYFPGATFSTMDRDRPPQGNHYRHDLCEPTDLIDRFDLVLLMSVLEHIERPWVAAPNISAMIRPGGHLYIAMPYFFPTHRGKTFGDFWRAHPDAMPHLFGDLTPVRHDFHPSVLLAALDRRRYWNEANSTATGWSMLLKKDLAT